VSKIWGPLRDRRKKKINIYHTTYFETTLQCFDGIKSLTADGKINENMADITLTRNMGKGLNS
jgi:hypothetical protein